MDILADILAKLIGPTAALAGVAIGYALQGRARTRERRLDAVFRALALAGQYQWDLREFGMAYVAIGDGPESPPGEDPQAVRQFHLDFSTKRFEDARRRLLDTERELRLVGAQLALFTDLHRRPGDTVTGFDVIVDETCGQVPGELVSEDTTDEDVADTVFRYGVILAVFEQEAVEYLRKHVDRNVRVPEHVSIGAPREARASESPATQEAGSSPSGPTAA